MHKKVIISLCVIVAAGSLVTPFAACIAESAVEPTVIGAEPTATPYPTYTPYPTHTPYPTYTPITSSVSTPTPSPPAVTPAPSGLRRSDPVPVGSAVKAGDGMVLMVGKVTRAKQAYDMVKGWNVFNDDPAPGKEILLVLVGVAFVGPQDETATASSHYFRVVGDSGVINESRWDVLEPEIDQKIFGGGKVAGYVSFDVPIGETGLILMYSPLLKGTVYLALE